VEREAEAKAKIGQDKTKQKAKKARQCRAFFFLAETS